jgi:putative transcriptional regulator
MKDKKTTSVGSELVRRLKGFTDALETTNDLSERFTCRSVKLNLKPHTYDGDMVRNCRKVLRASQPIFAQFLGVSPSAVRDWEQGLKQPGGAACRIMDEIQRSPEYFQSRLKELTVPAKAGE